MPQTGDLLACDRLRDELQVAVRGKRDSPRSTLRHGLDERRDLRRIFERGASGVDDAGDDLLGKLVWDAIEARPVEVDAERVDRKIHQFPEHRRGIAERKLQRERYRGRK